ncbi:MAG: hypothetical protein M1823_005448 [Watsoniomyces obsoletus]|nr:MAG: hypothetical protein M1823_005448 [Watsoniomyces obsoletus]
MRPRSCPRSTFGFGVLSALIALAHGADILRTSGFSTCLADAEIKVDRLDIQYNRPDKTVTFDVAGSSLKEQNVTASLVVTAYGKQVYQRSFNPCDEATKVNQLCPVPAGVFSARGVQQIPPEYANSIPDIAFQLPDLDGQAKLELKPVGGGKELACIESPVNNGKSSVVPAVSYLAVGVTGAALIVSGLSALSALGGGAGGGGPGACTPSPTFAETFGWFQSMALNGMLSVNYPPVYRSFTRNFAFSGGLIEWRQMQTSIDNFRNVTGGNLTTNSVAYLSNVTLVYRASGESSSPSKKTGGVTKRGIDAWYETLRLHERAINTNVNGSQTTIGGGPAPASNGTSNSKNSHVVHGIQAFAEQLVIPQSNTFMTVLLIFAIAIAAVTVGILLLKVILELWALCGSFPKKLTSFRKRYWGMLGRTIVNMILILYGLWTLYCIFEFTHGDSWGAKALAGVTLAAFTAILGFFTFKIWQLARRYKKLEGDTSGLYEDKDTWIKYSLFYDQYKKSLWWIFVPVIVYMFARGCVLAAGNGRGMVQVGAQLIIEAAMLILLVWSRPYETKSGNWINIIIQVVRMLSVICILVFVEQLGIAQTTKTVTGIVLIVMQSVLTATLVILIAVNAIMICCRANPHRKKRKEAEKLNRDLDNLTPLDPRNSLLMEPPPTTTTTGGFSDPSMRKDRGRFDDDSIETNSKIYDRYHNHRSDSPEDGRGMNMVGGGRRESRELLVQAAAGMPYTSYSQPGAYRSDRERDGDHEMGHRPGYARQPTLPNLGGGGGGGYR